MLGHWGRSRRNVVALVLAVAGLASAGSVAAQAPPSDPPATTTATVAPPSTDSATTAVTTSGAPPATAESTADTSADATAAVTASTSALDGAPALADVAAPAAVAEPVTTTPESVLATVTAAAIAPGYYRLAFSDAIYETSGGTARQLSYAEWLAAGSPAPQLAPTSYVGYSWSPAIYAVTKWNDGAESWQWDRLSYDQWRRAGSPAATAVAFIPGSYWYKWATSDELFVESPDGVNHKLTFGEWAAAGYQPYVNRSNEGFVKLTWSPSIARLDDVANGRGGPISFAEWADQGFPSPAVAPRITGDRFVQYVGGMGIFYSGPTLNRQLTFAEWSAAGSPTPIIETPPVPANSGSGRRVVYSRAQQRVWAIEEDGTVVKTHLVSGRLYEPYAGTYHVYSRSMYTYSTENPNVKWRYMVRFAYGPDGGRIGFHEIPNKNGVPMQAYSQLGQPLSGGCVRQTTDDAIWMWNWAGLGTTVVVL